MDRPRLSSPVGHRLTLHARAPARTDEAASKYRPAREPDCLARAIAGKSCRGRSGRTRAGLSMQPFRKSWRLAWPLILSNLSVPLLGVVDTAVVGHLDAPRYLGGVALGAMVMSVLYWTFGFLRMGTTALTAQAFGATDAKETRATLVRALLLATSLGFLVILLGPLVEHAQRPAVRAWTGRPRRVSAATWRSGCSARRRPWVAWRCWAGCLGLQDSRRPLLLMLLTNGINAVLAILFVLGPRSGHGRRGHCHGDRRICRPRPRASWSCATPGAAMAAGRAGRGS